MIGVWHIFRCKRFQIALSPLILFLFGGAFLAFLLLNPKNGFTKECVDLSDIGAVYKFDKLVLAITYSPVWAPSQPTFPSVLRQENLEKLLTRAVKTNFKSLLVDEDGNEKPVVALKSLGKNDGGDEFYVRQNLSILIQINYFPGNHPTTGIDEYGLLTFYVYRKDWDKPAAYIPGVNNSGILGFFPRRDNLQEVIDGFFSGIRPIQFAPAPWVVDKNCYKK